MLALVKSIATELVLLSNQACDLAAKAADIAVKVPSVLLTSLERLIPSNKPISITDIIEQTKKGSAILSSDEGKLFIKIWKNHQGQSVFKATNDLKEQKIIIQSEDIKIWELQVSEFLKKYVAKANSITYDTHDKRGDLLTRLFFGYLFVSGGVLTSWLTKSHLDQNLLCAATASSLGFLATHDPKVSLLAGLLSILPGTQAADSAARHVFSKRTAPISIGYPIPNLSVQPGNPLYQPINLQQNFVVTNPNANIDITMLQANGTAVPNWLSLEMGDFAVLSTIPGNNIFAVVVKDNYAYMGASNTLRIIDVRNPNNPIQISSATNSLQVPYVTLKGNYALVGTGNTQFLTYDITNPANVTLAYAYNFPNPCLIVSVANNHLYAVEAQYISLGGGNYYYNAYLTIVDYTNPIAPTQTSRQNLGPMGFSYPTLCVVGNYAYLSSNASKTQIFDVSDPANPFLANSILNTVSCEVKDEALYLKNNYYMEIFDITQILNPLLSKTVDLSFCGSGQSNMFKVDGNHLYVNCYHHLTMYNIANPLNPQLEASFTTPVPGMCLFPNGNKIYFGGTTGLSIIDASQRKLTGTPSLADRGLLLINMNATDGMGNSVVHPIAIHVGDINVSPIPNQQAYVGNTTFFTFDLRTFDYPHAPFAYTATLSSGSPLPSFISFDSYTRTFIFTPLSGNQNTYTIKVTADDGWGGSSSTTFDLTVPDRPPLIMQPLTNQTASSGEPFLYAFAPFTDTDLDIISYSANLQGKNGLPGWLSFDPTTRQFSGTPLGKGIYPIVVTGNDGFGGTVSNTFTITVPSTPPIVLNPIGSQTASTQNSYTLTFNTNTFYDIDNDPITYTTSNLPQFLIFNNATRTFTGTPQSQDVGVYPITLHANAAGGTASMTFNLNVVDTSNVPPPLVQKKIPNISEKVGVPFSFTFDANTFVDPQNGILTYEAELTGNLPLPTGLYFDSSNRTFTGIMQTPQSVNILVRAVNPLGGFAVDTFTMNVIANGPPIVLNPLSNAAATVNQAFTYNIPSNTFFDTTNDPIKISLLQSSGKPLPHWLKWDPKTNSLSGTPGPWDAGTTKTNEVDVDVWADDGTGSVKSSFKIVIEGDSFWTTFMKVGISLTSILGSTWGFWAARAVLWNHYNRDKYRDKDPQTVLVGHEFTYNFPTGFKNINSVQAFHEGKALAKLPSKLTHLDGLISGAPILAHVGRYTIRAYDHNGFCLKEFDLIIKENQNDRDPPEYKDRLQIALDKLTSGKHDENNNTAGQENALAKMMKKIKPWSKD